MTKEIRLSDKMFRYVQFSRFATTHAIDPAELAGLITLARRAFKAGERHSNSGTEKDREAELKAGEDFETAAMTLGFTVSWPGLWPRLAKDGYDVNLPALD